MQTTIYLDGRDYADKKAVHAALKLLLDLPEYYGMNADALHDCLTERPEPVRVCARGAETGPAADALRVIRQVVEDAGGEWVDL